MMILALGFLIWLCVSLATVGVLCFLLALLFRVYPTALTHRGMWRLYEFWVAMLAFWVKKLVPNITVVDPILLPKNRPFILIANHYSWLDILILYTTLFQKNRSFVFVMKRELLWAPMIGVICWGLGHPLLYRGREGRKNLKLLQKAAQKAKRYQHGVMIFPEGTRYTKNTKREPIYPHLLKPKTAGFSCLLKAFEPSIAVVDVTLVYDKPSSILDFLKGRTGRVQLFSQVNEVAPSDAEGFLAKCWQAKSQLIQKSLDQHSVTD